MIAPRGEGIEVDLAEEARANLSLARRALAVETNPERREAFRHAVVAYQRQLSTMGEPWELPRAPRRDMEGDPILERSQSAEDDAALMKTMVAVAAQQADAEGSEIPEACGGLSGTGKPQEESIARLVNASNRLAQIKQMIRRGDDQASILAAIDRAQAALGRAGDAPEILKRKPLHLATCDWGQPVFLSPHQDAIEVAFPDFLIEQGYRVEQDWAEAKDNRWATSSAAAERRALKTMDPEWAELARRLREVGL